MCVARLAANAAAANAAAAAAANAAAAAAAPAANAAAPCRGSLPRLESAFSKQFVVLQKTDDWGWPRISLSSARTSCARYT